MRDTVTILSPVRIIIDDRHTIEFKPGEHRQVTSAVRRALLDAQAASDDWRAKVNGDNERRPMVELSGFSLDELSTDRDGMRLCFLSRRASVKYHTPGKPAGFGAFEDLGRFSPNHPVWLSPEVHKLARKAKIAHLAPLGVRNYHYFSDATRAPHLELGWAPLPASKQVGDSTDDDMAA
ncbi:hypothetical protein SAMN05877838_3792 [Hoeflea halophila]|uniref:Uncharacterized protein n=1 Tax=Hoeflea halophila TaxID=714899 RepID=A0A286IFE8_9HYPH|nr:hypothetical protein [Hoeflea halophila]SOE18848.1 hypothetical protein SAMN05877838_3792 [Hoeflea halophila]